ncbi:MAG: leucine-rich repeat protein [Lachnospiraceae bacterium]|nr:leucine-rich repeat protein [Lachnospiraceae bacterium]
MSEKKKRLIMMVVCALACGLAAVALLFFVQEDNINEQREWMKQYQGVWTSENGGLQLTVWRVTSAHMVISLVRKQSWWDSPNGGGQEGMQYISASATGGNEYEFYYEPGKQASKEDIPQYINVVEGTLELLEEGIRVDMPPMENKANAWEFQGILKNKENLKKEAVIHLMDYMGTDRPLPVELKESAAFETDESGRVWRIHMVWDWEADRHFYCDMNGIGKSCFESDCIAALGELKSTEQLENNRTKLVFQDDTFQYTCILNAYGMVAEGDCQYRNREGMTRQGDFLLQGDTLVRYLGDYEKVREITLPQGVKKIAAGAFRVEKSSYNFNCAAPSMLTIPKEVDIEAEAFADCGKWQITFEKGRREIPERAFAHMVSVEEASEKQGWVEVTLPGSMRRLGRMAFGLDDSDVKLREYWQSNKALDEQPVSIKLNRHLEYIEDYALWGSFITTNLPEHLKEIGCGTTLYTEIAQMNIPEGVERLKRNSLLVITDLDDTHESGLYESRIIYLHLPAGLQEIEEQAIYWMNNVAISVKLEKENTNFKLNKEKWLFSKDGRILYNINVLGMWNDNGTSQWWRKPEKGKDKGKKRYEYILTIPEGPEEIRSDTWRSVKGVFHAAVELPKSLKSMDRSSLLLMSDIYLTGEVPEFYGTLTDSDLESYTNINAANDWQWKSSFYVPKAKKKEFVKKLLDGQNLSKANRGTLSSIIIKTY